MKPPTPPDESRRLRTLRMYRILDTGAEQAFDDLAALAAAICGTPIALVTLVDEHRQWFKARIGLDAAETSRDISFCAHTILEEDLLVVEDARLDARFAGNPYVTSAPNIRFYAGAALTMADGTALGSLCVLDVEPRVLTGDQRRALKALRRAVVSQLELRRALADLQDVERLLSMCAWCRRVQDDAGQWRSLHEYVNETVPVTHGLCPACAASVEASWRR